uniref:Uncharacterized protein n=1 Tax=Anopheles maculatus TaxID=74869 RepID=A0A182SMU7_9DIPT
MHLFCGFILRLYCRNGHLYPGRSSASIVNDRSVQHQISGYRKRQLYASAAPRRNVTGSTDGQFAKEFVPSPEVVPFFNEENSAPGSPAAGTVDASYPTGLADGDSRWYAGGMGLSGHGYVKAPSGSEENESSEGTKNDQRPKVSETPFSSSGSFEDHHFGRHHYTFPTASKNHPYSFDRNPIEGAFSIDPMLAGNNSSVSSGSSSSSNSGSGVSTESTEVSNGIGGLGDIKLVGKEDAHLKNVSPWKKIIHVLSAAIPIGLLISALTPQVVYINPNATQ